MGTCTLSVRLLRPLVSRSRASISLCALRPARTDRIGSLATSISDQVCPRGHVFLFSPLQGGVKDSVGDLLMDVDPRRSELWRDASLIEGGVGLGDKFKAFVPAKQHSPSPNSTIVERQVIVVCGKIVLECGKPYLIAVHGNPRSVSLGADWPSLEDRPHSAPG